MGRADLSRYRGTHPSESRQTTFPLEIQNRLQVLRLCPERQLSEAASSILNASTQRQQQTGIKALCATLPGSKNNPAVGAILGDIMTLTDTTSGIVSTALRGCLRTCIPEQVQTQLNALFSRLGKVDDFPRAVADMRLTAALLSEHDSRDLILAHETRINAVISQICQLVDIYLSSTTGDGTESYNARLLPDACDSAMKAAQDVLNFLHTRGEDRYRVEDIVIACDKVLGIEFVPRSCALACGVAYVTGRVLCSHARTTKEVEDVTIDILSYVKKFPPFSRLALLRALMEAPAARPALANKLFSSKVGSKSVFDSLAAIITANADVHLRFLAMDTLIACIRRAKPLPIRCRDVVLGLIYERWQEPFPGVASQIRETMEALLATDRGDDDIGFWTALAERLAGGDWKVKGIHAPLGVLVRRIGAKTMLSLKEDCQQLALGAVAVDYRLVKHAVDWLGSFWRALREEVSFEGFLRITGGTLVEGLVDSKNRTLRERTAEHALPVYFRTVRKGDVAGCANWFLSYLAGMKSSCREARARGTVSILSVVRKSGVFLGSFTDPEIYGLLQSALLCTEEDVRSSALELIVTTRVPTEPVLQQELDLVQGYLPNALTPGGSLADRSRFRHCMRRLYERLAACRHAAKDGSSGWWMRVRKERFDGMRTPEFEDMRTSLLERIARFECDVLSVLLASCYPGAAFTRMSSALEVLELQFKNLGCNAFETARSAQESLRTSFFVCLTDEWERPRRAALQVLSTLKTAVPSDDDLNDIIKLQKYATSLLYSAKQKDVDSGASLLRALFRKYVLCDRTMLPGYLVPQRYKTFNSKATHLDNFEGPLEERNMQNGRPTPKAALRGFEYIIDALNSVKDTLDQAESDFTRSCRHGLFHGQFLLLRCIFQDMPWKSLPLSLPRCVLISVMDEVVDLSWKCSQVAMKGVSFRAFEEHMADVDTLEEDYVIGDDDILLKEKRQLESTSCFQSIKEISIALGILSHEVPIGVLREDDGHQRYLMEEKQVTRIGKLFLYIFQNTRHWGVLDGASEGFQLLCESLLRCSASSLRSLPRKWCRETIRLALSEGLYVLRRSAGVPAVINAVVNAEGNCNRRSYESPLLHEACSALLDHLDHSAMFTDEHLLGRQRSKEEESVAHSLNLLRSLFLNSNVATTILRHLERAAICCLKAFRSASWLIRNSSMMLFSAIIRRGIGACVERKAELATSSFDSVGGTSAMLEGERRLRGTTAFQFFSRHPKLHPFLLKTLQESAEHLESGVLEDQAALYPALYLLSCLSPATAEDPSNAISMKPFRSILRQCSHGRSDYVRRIAAAAYVPILEDPSHISKAVQEIFSDVPVEPDTVMSISHHELPRSAKSESRTSNSCTLVGRVRRLSQNRLHGDLLTVSGILSRTKDVMSCDDMRDTVRVLTSLLPTRIWIAANGKKNPCSYTRAAMISVVSAGYVLAKEVKNRQPTNSTSGEADALLTLCADLGHKLVDFSDQECGFGATVGMACLRKRTGEFLLRKSLVDGQDAETAFIISLKSHLKQTNSTNRDNVLCGFEGCVAVVSKQMLKIEWSGVPGQETKIVLGVVNNMWECSRDVLRNKDDQELVVAALRLQIALLASLKKVNIAEPHVICKFTNSDTLRITDWSRFHPCVDIREYALTLLGKLVSHRKCSKEVLTRWINATEAASTSQATTTRMASCTTVGMSGLERTMTNVDIEGDIVARGYLVLARMLEDDHADVRRHALRIIQQYISLSVSSEDLSISVLPSLLNIYGKLGRDSPVCESLFATLIERLGKATGHDGSESDMLLQAVASITGCRPQFIVTRHEVNCSSEKDNSVDPRKDPSRLFRLEDEVDEGEPVLRLQLITFCFRDIILSRKGDPPEPIFLEETFQLLISDLKNLLTEDVKTTELPIICGSTFTPKGFLSCLKTMLRLFLGTCCLCATNLPKTMGDSLQTVAEELRRIGEKHRHVLHPVLYAVLNGLCTILTKDCSEAEIRSTSQILFLLTS